MKDWFSKKCAKRGYWDLLRWGKKNGCRVNCGVLLEAVTQPHAIPFLEWSEKKKLRELPNWWTPEYLVTCAASKGRLENVKWLREKGEPWHEIRALAAAAFGGHVEVLTWVEEAGLLPEKEIRKGGSEMETLLMEAVYPEKFSMEGLVWLEKRGIHFSFAGFGPTCALAGEMHVLLWLWGREEKSEITWGDYRNISEAAASGGHVDILKWVWEVFPELHVTPTHTTNAAQSGKLGALKFLLEKGGPEPEEKGYLVAAYNGHRELVQWAMEEGGWRGCKEVCEGASMKGDLEFLKWAREKGCPWDYRVYLHAGIGGSVDILEWARREGCPWLERLAGEVVLDRGPGTRAFLEWVWEKELEVDWQRVVEYLEGNKRRWLWKMFREGGERGLKVYREFWGCSSDEEEGEEEEEEEEEESGEEEGM